MSERTRDRVAFALLALSSLVYRLPLLLDPDANSDAATTGLQAMHILRGELSPFLWGKPYLSSLEAMLAALATLLLGARPFTLAFTPVALHLVLAWILYRMVRRCLSPAAAAVVSLPLVMAVHPLVAPVIYSYRELAVVAGFAGASLADTAPGTARPAVRLALGAALAAFAVYLDLYMLQLLPGFLLLAALASWDGPPERRRARLGAAAAGACTGLALVYLLRHGADASAAHATLSRLGRNLGVLWPCLGDTVGSWWRRGDLPVPAQDAAAAVALRALGALSLCTALAAGAVLSLRSQLSPGARRLGLTGAALAATTCAAFLVSSLTVNIWSSRYLAPLLWAAPLALTPLAARVGPRRLALWLTPWAISASVAACISLGAPWLVPRPWDGLRPDDRALESFLRGHEVHAAAGWYWDAYWLTYIFGEDPVVVPIDPNEDRYLPYRDVFDSAPRVAYLFDHHGRGPGPERLLRQLEKEGVPFQRAEVGRFTVVLLDRSGSGAQGEGATPSGNPGPR